MKNYSLEMLISKTLRTGITIAAALGISGAWYLETFGSHQVSFDRFGGTSDTFLSPAAIIAGIARGHGTVPGERSLALAQLGILLLLATPVIRVLFSVVGFAGERDWTYVTITSLVLGTLLVSIFLL